MCKKRKTLHDGRSQSEGGRGRRTPSLCGIPDGKLAGNAPLSSASPAHKLNRIGLERGSRHAGEHTDTGGQQYDWERIHLALPDGLLLGALLFLALWLFIFAGPRGWT
ncbi:MAG: hypothetical protein ACLSB9_08595 [Hydrogeniiclostridium mannosilyticum]